MGAAPTDGTTRARWARAARAAVVGGALLAAAAPLVAAAPAGAAAAPSYPVSATVDGRLTRSLADHAAPRRYPTGTRVTVACQTTGPAVGGNRIWNLTGDGLWVPDRYVRTGRVGFLPGTPRCALPRTLATTRAVTARRTKTSADTRARALAAGTRLAVVCQAAGGATGSRSQVWDRTADGWWVPDVAVKTGVDGFLAGLPRCDLDRAALVTPAPKSTPTPTPAPTPTPTPTPTPPPVSTPAGPRVLPAQLQFSAAGAAFLARFEGYVGAVYNDPVGNCTIGYGHLLHSGACTPADAAQWGTMTQPQALALLRTDADTFAAGLRRSLATTPLRQNEFDALVSFGFNVGLGGFGRSSVHTDLVATPPAYSAVPAHLMLWTKAGGRPLCILYRRRVNEGALFTTGSYTMTTPACPATSLATAPDPRLARLSALAAAATPDTPADLRPQPVTP